MPACRYALLAVAILLGIDGASAKVACTPLTNTARILVTPNPNDIHPDWRGENYVGTAWSVVSPGKAVVNDTGRYLKGDLYSPRGGRVNRSVFILVGEWDCTRQ